MLRSIKDLPGFRIAAKDGDIGMIKGAWLSREVLISSEAVIDHSWEGETFSDDKWKYTVPGYDQADYKKHVVHFKETADIL
jgi:hypothetical protein